MPNISTKKIHSSLKAIHLSGDTRDIVSAGYVKTAEAHGGIVRLVVELPGALDKAAAEALQRACEQAVKKISGVENVMTVVTAASQPAPPARAAPPSPKPIPGVKHAIAVAAGKGGVGKSTVAANLAVALAALGHRVGLVDADIYGPSVARMMRLSGQPETASGKMIPPERHGVKCISMALLLDENAPAVWRAPMATKALAQLVHGVAWGELDYLVFDLPPGTGDIHLTIAQNFLLSGAVVVSTPQEVALLDVRKAIGMLQKVGTRVVGLVENMSYLENDGERHYIFGRGGVRKLADELGLDVLAELPIEPAIAQTSDAGTPIAAGEGKVADVFREIARKVVAADHNRI